MDISKVELPEGWFSKENIETYRKLFNQIPINGVVVELGCWKGRSICSVADIIKERKLQVYLVDSFSGADDEVGQYGDVKTVDVKQVLLNNLKSYGLNDVVVVPLLTTEAARNYFYIERFDLVFIDADHSYKAVYQDITDWIPKVKSGGIIAGHDFFRDGVNKALHELLWPVESESTIWYKTTSQS